jgi:hypothetical protein
VLRQRSEQYFTSSQTFSHFLRHVKGLPQVAQVLVGSSDFRIIFGMGDSWGMGSQGQYRHTRLP